MALKRGQWADSSAYKAYVALGHAPKNCPQYAIKDNGVVVRRGECYCRMPIGGLKSGGLPDMCRSKRFSERGGLAGHVRNCHGPIVPLTDVSCDEPIMDFYKGLMKDEDYDGKSETDTVDGMNRPSPSKLAKSSSAKRALLEEEQVGIKEESCEDQTESPLAKKLRYHEQTSAAKKETLGAQSDETRSSFRYQGQRTLSQMGWHGLIDLTEEDEREVEEVVEPETAAGSGEAAAASHESSCAPIALAHQIPAEQNKGRAGTAPSFNPVQLAKRPRSDECAVEEDEDDLNQVREEIRIKSQLRQAQLQEQLDLMAVERKLKNLQKRKAAAD